MRWHRYKCKNCQEIKFLMYILASRAHFCHLLGLSQVGHSPRGTSGSGGTLDWGLMWSGSQSTCHPNTPLTPLTSPKQPFTPCRSSQYLLMPYTTSDPWVPRVPTSPPIQPLHPLHLLKPPDIPNSSLHPLGGPQFPLMPYIPSGPWVSRVPASPPIHTWHPITPHDLPKMAPTPLATPIMAPNTLHPLVCYCLQFSIDHLYVNLVIMIQVGSIFQIPLCIVLVTGWINKHLFHMLHQMMHIQ